MPSFVFYPCKSLSSTTCWPERLGRATPRLYHWGAQRMTSEIRRFEQWRAALDDRIAATAALDAKPFPEGLGWFAFEERALEQDYLEYSFATWTPRTKIIARVSAVYWSLLSLASMLDWSWYLNSTGLPANAADAIQTHAPTCVIMIVNVVLHTPLWSPGRFQAMLSLFVVTTALAFLLPMIIERPYMLGPVTPAEVWVLEHYPLQNHTHGQSEISHVDNLASYIAEQLAAVQYEASLHFAGAGCLSMVISLVPCGPFAPLGTILIMLGLVVIGALRFRVFMLDRFGMEPPDNSAFLYALLIVPVAINALTWRRAERHQFLMFVKSRRQSELQLERLRQEKERLDYERRFAVHQMQRSHGAAGEDDRPSSCMTGSFSSVAPITISRRQASLPPGPPSSYSSSAQSAGEPEMGHTVHVAPAPVPRLAPSEAVAGQGGNFVMRSEGVAGQGGSFVTRFWYALPRVQDVASFGGKPHPNSRLATATSADKRHLPACASKPAPSPPCAPILARTADPESTAARAPVRARTARPERSAASVPVLDRLLAELEQIAMVEQMTEQEQLEWREDWARLTQGRGRAVLPEMMAEVALVEAEVAREEDAGHTDRQTEIWSMLDRQIVTDRQKRARAYSRGRP